MTPPDSDNFDPDDNFRAAFSDYADLDEDAALEAVVWQFLLLINPGEHVEYSETIATRELSPGKVFAVEVVVPAYPELDAQRKSIAAP